MKGHDRLGTRLPLLSLVCLAGCSSVQPQSGPLQWLLTGTVAQDCETAAPGCVEQRSANLRAMLADRSHAWVSLPPNPAGYANGTRLFAYRIARTKLTCAQLAAGLDELQHAGGAYANPIPGVVAPQSERVRRLIGAVHHEIGVEKRRRCKT